jgi:hypothetical protein
LRSRLRLFLVSLVLLALLGVAPAPARAQDYKGTTAEWAELTISVNGGQVTAFSTQTARVPCPGQVFSVDPITVALAPGTIVPVSAGRFHVEGHAETGQHRPVRWTADGSVSLDQREVSGTLVADTTDIGGATCQGSYGFDAIIPPHTPRFRPSHTFQGKSGGTFNPNVSFDYKQGVIKHLSAWVRVQCPDGGSYNAQLDTTAYGMDPVRVSASGRFQIVGALLDPTKAVVHFTLSGRTKGRKATGTISSYRYEFNGGSGQQNVRCEGHASWRSVAPRRIASNGPLAFFNALPIRVGRAGAWTYYVQIKFTGCLHANFARVRIAGRRSQTTRCHGQLRLGPLAPKRAYKLGITALKVRHGKTRRKQAMPPATIYVPGDDGDWVLLR